MSKFVTSLYFPSFPMDSIPPDVSRKPYLSMLMQKEAWQVNYSTSNPKRLSNRKEIDPEQLAIEVSWVNNLLDQTQFAEKALQYYHVRLIVKEYYSCYPDCFSQTDPDPNLEHKLSQESKGKALAA